MKSEIFLLYIKNYVRFIISTWQAPTVAKRKESGSVKEEIVVNVSGEE